MRAGSAILCADTCEANGLVLPPLSQATVEELQPSCRPKRRRSNPVDMIASATGQDYERAVLAVASDPDVDIADRDLHPSSRTACRGCCPGDRTGYRKLEGGTPVLTSFMSGGQVPVDPESGRGWFPSFAFPEQAAIAAARAVEHGRWRDRAPAPCVASPMSGPMRPMELSLSPLPRERLVGTGGSRRVARCYGIPVAHVEVGDHPGGGGALRGEFGVPVALKAIGPLHKSDVGGVRWVSKVRRWLSQMRRRCKNESRRLGQPLTGFSVQEMAEGMEVLVGVTHDDVFGPIVACGAGGTIAELLKDVAVRVAPVTDTAAREMVRSLKTFPLLEGYRGAPRADVPSLEEVILRVSALRFGPRSDPGDGLQSGDGGGDPRSRRRFPREGLGALASEARLLPISTVGPARRGPFDPDRGVSARGG